MVLLRMTDFSDYIIAHGLIPLVNICSSIAFVLVIFIEYCEDIQENVSTQIGLIATAGDK